MYSFSCQSVLCGTRHQTETLLHVLYGFFKNKFEVHIERLKTELATQLLTLCSEIKVNVLRKHSFLKLVLRKCADDMHRLFCFAVTTMSIHK